MTRWTGTPEARGDMKISKGANSRVHGFPKLAPVTGKGKRTRPP